MRLIRSSSRRGSVFLMNCGAKVLHVPLLLLLESDLSRAVLASDSPDDPNAENDWLRLWVKGLGEAWGDVKTEDLGLGLDTIGLVEGDWECRSKGLFRHLGPTVAAVDMLMSLTRPNVPGGKIGNKLSLEKQLNAQNLNATRHGFSQNSTDLDRALMRTANKVKSLQAKGMYVCMCKGGRVSMGGRWMICRALRGLFTYFRAWPTAMLP